MIYYRCKCGKSESWSSMGSSPCKLCKECGTTLASGPEDHKTEPEAHDWFEEETITTYRGIVSKKHYRKCLTCGDRENIAQDPPHTVPI